MKNLSQALTLIWLLWLYCEKKRLLDFEYIWDSVRGLTGTPPTPLNVAVLCHLAAVLIYVPYPGRDARWKQKERQEDANITLRSHTICPFHERADGRGGNVSLNYKQAPAYFKVTCESRHLQGTSLRDSGRYWEFTSFWNEPQWLQRFRQDYVWRALEALLYFDSNTSLRKCFLTLL